MTFADPVDLDRVASAIEQIAHEEIVPRFRALAPGEIREKAPGDFVTAADEASEARLLRVLHDLRPDAIQLGEEAANGHAAALDQLRSGAPTWVVDPLDGTRPFAHGQHGWGVLVAFCQGGVPVAGWMHDPLRGITAYGSDTSAWVRPVDRGRAGRRRPLVLSAHPETHDYIVLDAYGQSAGTDALRAHARAAGWNEVESAQAGINAGLALLRGDVAFAACTLMRPWDVLPAAAVIRAAGGACDALDHSAYPLDGTGHTCLIARTPLLARQLKRAVACTAR